MKRLCLTVKNILLHIKINLKDYIRSIKDYPKKGILFRDITTLIKNERAFAKCIEEIVERTETKKPEIVPTHTHKEAV